MIRPRRSGGVVSVDVTEWFDYHLDRFVESVKNHFGSSKYEDPQGALSKLLQLGTIEDYRRFETIAGKKLNIEEKIYIVLSWPSEEAPPVIKGSLDANEDIGVVESNKVEETEARVEATVHNEKETTKKEETIKETADTLTSLQSKVASLKEKGSLDANEEIKKDHTLVHELEKHVEKLPMELQLKNNVRGALETKDLKKKMIDLNSMLHDLQEVKTRCALKN
ncbi:hypothetical protein Tco_0748490 [Tanacetum coccineum]|uniref:Uncharacterized protein n=1 Tax=Tanacetum coccineum TaxID=301880 RepID=A0ABQ4YVS1_9ASTR